MKMSWSTNTEAGPCCAECGYLLTGLDASGQCPECGCSVALSATAQRHHAMLRRDSRILRSEKFYRTYRYNAIGLVVFGLIAAAGLWLVGLFLRGWTNALVLAGLFCSLPIYGLVAWCAHMRLQHLESIEYYRGRLKEKPGDVER